MYWLILLCCAVVAAAAEYCDNGTGECKELSDTDCPAIFFNPSISNVKYCDAAKGIVCCPVPRNLQHRPTVDSKRKFERECRRYSEALPRCKSTGFIVGGQKAEPREYPFMALLGTRERLRPQIRWDCGGTLIHPRYVLTAAHCLYTSETKEQRLDPDFNSPKFVVRLGELDYNSTTDDARPEDFNVVNYVVHPSYNDNDAESNDIALIELDRNATFSEYIAPACLPASAGNEHQQLTAAGWGLTKDAGEKSSHLLKVTLQRFTDAQCVERVEQQIETRTQFCAGSYTSNADTCNGDSGGPIFVQHPRYGCLSLLIGITSYGQVCGTRNLPSVYTKIHLYTDWIENIVWADG